MFDLFVYVCMCVSVCAYQCVYVLWQIHIQYTAGLDKKHMFVFVCIHNVTVYIYTKDHDWENQNIGKQVY